jgi:death-on-curing family protein
VSSRRVNYPDYEDFSILLFAIVNEQFNRDPNNPLPDYSKENPQGLISTLLHAQNDDFYPTVVDKAAYIFVSIIDGHNYSNGNKRLGLVTMVYFLYINGCTLNTVAGELTEWALYVADSKRNGDKPFDQLKEYVKEKILLSMKTGQRRGIGFWKKFQIIKAKYNDK